MAGGKLVSSQWNAGNLEFLDSAGNVIFTIDGANRKVTYAAGAALQLPPSYLGMGFIPLPLTAFRLITSNDIAAKNAADGGLISLDTDPTLKRVNAATDKNLRLAWAANSVIPVTIGFAYPPDLDDTAPVIVNLIMGKDTNTNTTFVLGVAYFEGVGDTNAGGNTAAVTETTGQNLKTVTIAASDVAAYPQSAIVELTPAAHANDAIYVYGAFITYTRKLT